jgi:hypothetical protein
MPSAYRSLVFPLTTDLPPNIHSLMRDDRLLVPQLLRFSLNEKLTARGSLTKFAQPLDDYYRVNWMHASTAMPVALSLAKGHRRRLRKGETSSVPYVRKPFLRADDQTFHFDANSGT